MASWYDPTMKLVKTTLRIDAGLKKDAERLAIEQDTSFQEVFNRALENYLTKDKTAQKTASVDDQEFAKLLKKVNQEYGPALRKLAKL